MWEGSEGAGSAVSPARAELAHGSPAATQRLRPAIFKDNTSTVKYYNI